MREATYNDNVFINCPFDDEYRPIFYAVVFTIYDCGFVARCSLEEDATGDVRFTKIIDILEDCRYAVHDISRTELDEDNGLPRFNMPLELGVFLGARRFGDKEQRAKKFLILDREKFRYQKFVSDLAGYDIRSHDSNARRASGALRDWLVTASRRKLIPSKAKIWERYQQVRSLLPGYCEKNQLDPDDLLFLEYSWAVADLLEEID